MSESSAEECVLCANSPTAWAVLDCGHVLCCPCALRLRLKPADPAKARSCIFCHQRSAKVVVTREPAVEPVADVSRLYPAADSGPLSEVYAADQGMLDEISYLTDLWCPRYADCHVQRPFDSIERLQQHLIHQHKVSFCSVCLEAKPVFVGEQRLYSQRQLQRHESTRERCDLDESNFGGHPECLFCKRRVYDGEALYMHMQETHFSCGLCEQRGGGLRELRYYRSEPQLRQHTRDAHYYCGRCDQEHAADAEKHWTEWSFDSEIELAAHMRTAHGSKQTLQLGFGSRGAAGSAGRGAPSAAAAAAADADRAASAAGSVITFDFGGRAESVSIFEFGGGDGGGRGRGRRGQQQGGNGYVSNLAQRRSRSDSHSPTPGGASNPDQELMRALKRALGGDAGRFNRLRLLGAQLMSGAATPQEYHDNAAELFGGVENLREVLPDILELLPESQQSKREGLRLINHQRITHPQAASPPPEPPPEQPRGGRKGKKGQKDTAAAEEQRKKQRAQELADQAVALAQRERGGGTPPKSGGARATTPKRDGRTTPPRPATWATAAGAGDSVPSVEDFPALPGQRRREPKTVRPAAAAGGGRGAGIRAGGGRASGGVWAQKAQARERGGVR
eukprot:TRINITY_DN55530_c0_g1_i1.p1 TRINITY_DN55530_c0_g1~~TRINITY_DN55530_c0_g1_i1.p1  ORF type:complete len:646 (+),score=187.29 TRINITY_DN55530_c0_g1_i1:76-1938(+)